MILTVLGTVNDGIVDDTYGVGHSVGETMDDTYSVWHSGGGDEG